MTMIPAKNNGYIEKLDKIDDKLISLKRSIEFRV